MSAPSTFSLMERIRRDGHPTRTEWAQAIDEQLPAHQADVVALVLESAMRDQTPDWKAIGAELGIHPNTARARLKAAADALPAILHALLDAREARHK